MKCRAKVIVRPPMREAGDFGNWSYRSCRKHAEVAGFCNVHKKRRNR